MNPPLEAWWRDEIAGTPAALGALFRLAAPDAPAEGEPRVWKEFHTPVGRVDLLLSFGTEIAAFEFKRDEAGEDAVAQVLRYGGALAWYHPALAVVSRRFTLNARYAALAAGVVLIEVGVGVAPQRAAIPPVTAFSKPLVDCAFADVYDSWKLPRA